MNHKSLIPLCIFLLLVCKSTLAQTTKSDTTQIPRAYWVAGGLGASSQGIELMSNANAELGHSWLITSTAQIESGIFGGGREVEQFNLMIGKIHKWQGSFMSYSAGLSIVYVDKITVGIPVLFQIYGVAGQFIGLGINACANLNPTTPTAGLSLNIALGHIALHR